MRATCTQSPEPNDVPSSRRWTFFRRLVDAYRPTTAFGLLASSLIGISSVMVLTLKPENVSTPNALTVSSSSSFCVRIGGLRRRLTVSKVAPRSM